MMWLRLWWYRHWTLRRHPELDIWRETEVWDDPNASWKADGEDV